MHFSPHLSSRASRERSQRHPKPPHKTCTFLRPCRSNCVSRDSKWTTKTSPTQTCKHAISTAPVVNNEPQETHKMKSKHTAHMPEPSHLSHELRFSCPTGDPQMFPRTCTFPRTCHVSSQFMHICFFTEIVFDGRCEGKCTSKGPCGSLPAVSWGMQKRCSCDGGRGFRHVRAALGFHCLDLLWLVVDDWCGAKWTCCMML